VDQIQLNVIQDVQNTNHPQGITIHYLPWRCIQLITITNTALRTKVRILQKHFKNGSLLNAWRIFTSRSIKNQGILIDEQSTADYVGQALKHACG
jgi:hypothetical protein